jgi:3',5'-cyclic AMP phosphodiesterase CpdA
MKIRVLSDLHIEWGPLELSHAGEDIAVLCGDIAIHTEAMDLLKQMAQLFDIPIIVLAGNHEFYTNEDSPSHTWEGTIDELREAADLTDRIEKGKVTFFEDSSAVYEGVRFIGATLWTDMHLYGDDPLVQIRVEQSLNDYRLIKRIDGGDLRAMDTIARHGVSRQFITDKLAEPFEGPTVVLTHHAPSWLSVPEQFKADASSAGYASRLETIMLDFEPALWVHGHMHTSLDYEVGETRIVCNPRGYARASENPAFDPNLIIDLMEKPDDRTDQDQS